MTALPHLSHWPRWIAHRGAGKLAPENTLAAFRVGAAHGWRAFECDVKLSADGVAFLLHDATLDRTTSGSGPAGDLSWDALSRLDAGAWHGRAHAGEPLPRLEGIARFCIANGFALNIEIKPMPGTAEATGDAVARHAAVLWAGASSPLLLSSFDPAALQAARAAAPELPRALLLETLPADWLAQARTLGCAALVTQHTSMEAPVLDALHAAGLRGLVYTVDDAAEARRLLAIGIDGIITDAVDRFAPARSQERGRQKA